MDLNLYFEPVSIIRESRRNVTESDELSHKLYIHTPDYPIGPLNTFDLAIVGVPEDRGALIPGQAKAPDLIRKKLYSLGKIQNKIRIADLGNMKPGKNINDTYAGLQYILDILIDNRITPIVIGGSQDLTIAAVKALCREHEIVRLVTIDPRLDLTKGGKKIFSDTYLSKLLKDHHGKLRYTNLGQQEFLTSARDLKYIRSKGHESYRLGEVKANLPYFESFLRDGDMLSVDLSAIRQGDAPGTSHPVPGGFTIDEICQLSRYAGLSQYQKIFSLFELHPDSDRNEQTAALAAQMIWYFLSGFSLRKPEDPGTGGSRFTEYIITLPDTEYRLIFRKSEETGRWWLRFPDEIKPKGERTWIACSYEDYQMATRHEIPGKWLNLFRL